MPIKRVAMEHVHHITDEMKQSLGDAWDTVTPEERETFERTARRRLELEIKQRQGQDVSEDLDFITITVAEFTVAGEFTLGKIAQDAFWKGVDKGIALLGQFLASVGKGLIPGL